MSAQPLHPDWGPIDARDDNGEVYGNPASVLSYMRFLGTPEWKRAYRSTCLHWHRIKDLPGQTVQQKQMESLAVGFAEIGVRIEKIA